MSAGGSSPSRNDTALTKAIAWAAARPGEPLDANATPTIATVMVAAANASMRMRLRATEGCRRPARQRRVVTAIERNVQWTRNGIRYAVNHAGRASPAPGTLGSAKVQIETAIVSAATARCSAADG